METLNDKHIDMLFEMSDIHFQCFELYYNDYGIKYEEVLELNHKKMIDIIKICSLERANEIFKDMLDEYKDMLIKNNRNKF